MSKRYFFTFILRLSNISAIFLGGMMKIASLLLLSILFSAQASAVDYAGKWESPCVETRVGEFQRLSWDLDSTKGEYVTDYFKSSSCLSKTYSSRMTLQYVVGLPFGPSGARDLDVKIEQHFETIYDKDMVDALNAVEYMGFQDWQVDQERETTGISHKGEAAPPKGYQFFTIAKQDKDELVFGLITGHQNGSSSKLRPKKLDNSVIFKKK